MNRSQLQPRLLAFALAISTVILSDSDAVTIYRIGGENLAPPEVEGPLEIMRLTWDELPAPEVDGASRFIQLPWQGTDETLFGSNSLVELDADFIAPSFLDPEVNLTPLVRSRGGSIQSTDGYTFKDELALDFMFDEDPTTSYSGGGSHFSWGAYKVLEVNLGGPLPVSRIVLYPTPEYADQRFVTEFTIAVNDGDERKDGLRGTAPPLDPPLGLANRSVQYARAYGSTFRDWEKDGTVFSATANRISRLDLEVKSFPTQKIFLIGRVGEWEIAELEIYGDGFVPQANYRSNILDLGQPSTLGELVWTGNRDPDATVDLLTRSGDTRDPNTYWRYTFRGDERSSFDTDGKALTRAAFDKLEGGEKAGITPDTGNWQFWSTPLDFEGGEAPLAANRPRQYVQFDVDLRSSNTTSSGRIDYLEFRTSSPPVVSQIVAEIAPRVVPARTMTQFRYLLLPTLFDTDIGFDSIEIDTATEIASVDSVRINDVYIDRSEWDWTPGEGSFVVNLPHVDLQRTDELIEIVFQTEVFKYGTVFKSRVFDSSRLDEPRQLVAAGDADGLVDSNTLSVGLADLGQSSIQALQLSSPVATPNGDGVNDVIEISFDLVNLSGAVPVTLGLYDLAGRKIVDVFDGTSASGRQGATWDGSVDDSGTLAVPGVYFLRLDVDADEGSNTALGIVSVAY